MQRVLGFNSDGSFATSLAIPTLLHRRGAPCPVPLRPAS